MSQNVLTKQYENRQADFTHTYTIEFSRESNGIYTLWARQRPRNPYSEDGDYTHVDAKTGQICVARGREPRSLEVAEAIAYYWMDGYSTYVRTGAFPDRGGRVRVPD